MKPDLMDILCCPVCKEDLVLKATKKDGKEIVEGTITCTKCKHPYPIEEGIPNLLPPE